MQLEDLARKLRALSSGEDVELCTEEALVIILSCRCSVPVCSRVIDGEKRHIRVTNPSYEVIMVTDRWGTKFIMARKVEFKAEYYTDKIENLIDVFKEPTDVSVVKNDKR